MHQEAYTLEFGASLLTFEFVSEGPKGRLLTIIQFTKIETGIYNLAFGDADAVTGALNDTVVSNNRDSEQVLATVNTATNIRLAIWRLKCLYETFVQGSTAVIFLTFCAKFPPHRQAEKRRQNVF